MFCVMIEFHPMAGVDFHEDIPPALPPVPVPFAPHAVAALMNWVIPSSTADTVLAIYGRVMQRGTDIQSLIPHIPLSPACLLALPISAFSGSKSYFGPASVQAKGKPIAVAVAVVINYNLNCGDIPTPTGIVIAPNIVVAGMTWGDFIGGVLAMVADCAVQTLMNLALGGLGPWGSGIAGILLGSPLGFSANANGNGPIGIVGRLVGDYNDFVRGAGESIGGDTAQGHADQQAAIDAAKKEADWRPDPNDPLNPTHGWNILGKDGDLGRVVQAPLPLRPFTNGAIDNPLAEAF